MNYFGIFFGLGCPTIAAIVFVVMSVVIAHAEEAE